MPQCDIIKGSPVPDVAAILKEGDFDRDADDTADHVNGGIPAMPGDVERISRTRHLFDVARETGVAPDDWSQLSGHRQMPDIDTGRMKNERIRA